MFIAILSTKDLFVILYYFSFLYIYLFYSVLFNSFLGLRIENQTRKQETYGEESMRV